MMINYFILAITVACTIFNIWLTIKDRDFRSGYDRGLEDGIRLTNEVIEEDQKDKPQTDFENKPYLYRDMDGYLCEEEDLDVPFLEIGNNEQQIDCPGR